jgi:hypothetical protein
MKGQDKGWMVAIADLAKDRMGSPCIRPADIPAVELREIKPAIAGQNLEIARGRCH